jgi:magnesium-transporting ATPase (P-type)
MPSTPPEQSPRAPTATAWHAMPTAEVHRALRLGDPKHGLAPDDAASRLAEHGPNALPAPAPVTLGTVILHQFLSPLIYILLAAAVVSAALADFVDAGFITLIVVFNAALGTYQEWKAERSAAGLQQLLTVQAHVRRGGADRVISADELVPGDVVLLESGNRVPADLRLHRVRDLAVDESFLTGESVAVEKHTEPLAEPSGVADRRNLAFAGSTVVSGRGAGVVIATGARTEVGRIARSVADTAATKAPLVLRMERFARHISVVVLASCALLGAVALSRGLAPMDVFFLAVALAVSAIRRGCRSP